VCRLGACLKLADASHTTRRSGPGAVGDHQNYVAISLTSGLAKPTRGHASEWPRTVRRRRRPDHHALNADLRVPLVTDRIGQSRAKPRGRTSPTSGRDGLNRHRHRVPRRVACQASLAQWPFKMVEGNERCAFERGARPSANAHRDRGSRSRRTDAFYPGALTPDVLLVAVRCGRQEPSRPEHLTCRRRAPVRLFSGRWAAARCRAW
jgi:hypothetical protein